MSVEGEMNKQAPREVGGRWGLWMAVVLAVFYLVGAFRPVIYDETEGQYAGAARAMVESGDWLVPMNNGVPRLQKPPLQYWLMAASMTVLGVNEFAARLPNALGTLAWLYAVYLVGCRVRDAEMGRFAVLMLAGSGGFFVFCHVIMPEPWLGLFITLTLWTYMGAWREPERARGWMTWAWVFMALGSFSKGLHGAVWPLGTALAAVVFIPESRATFRHLLQWRGPLLFLAVWLPWHLAVELRLPGFLMDQLINEQVGHAIDKRWPPSSNQVALPVYVLQHVFMLMPAMLFLPAAVRSWWIYRQQRTEKRVFTHRLMIIWFGITFVTTLFSARQDYYTMSAWGVWAVFLATPWITEARLARFYYIIPCGLLAVAGLAGMGAAVWLMTQETTMRVGVLPIVERDHLWTALQGFSLGAWRDFFPLLLVTGCSLAVGGLLGVRFAWKQEIHRAGLAFGASMALPFLMAVQGFSVKEDYFSLEPAARILNREMHEGDRILYDGYPNLASSLFFYLNHRVHWIDVPVEYEYATRRHGIGREYYHTRAEVVDSWSGPQRQFMICEEDAVAGWRRDLGAAAPWHEVARSGTRIVVSNRAEEIFTTKNAK